LGWNERPSETFLRRLAGLLVPEPVQPQLAGDPPTERFVRNAVDSYSLFARANKIDQETGYKRGFGFVLSGWGRVLLEQDRLQESRTKLEDALRIRKEIGNPDMVGDSLLSLAELTLEEGHPVEAGKLARPLTAS
jgi:hypothetical protein